MDPKLKAEFEDIIDDCLRVLSTDTNGVFKDFPQKGHLIKFKDVFTEIQEYIAIDKEQEALDKIEQLTKYFSTMKIDSIHTLDLKFTPVRLKYNISRMLHIISRKELPENNNLSFLNDSYFTQCFKKFTYDEKESVLDWMKDLAKDIKDAATPRKDKTHLETFVYFEDPDESNDKNNKDEIKKRFSQLKKRAEFRLKNSLAQTLSEGKESIQRFDSFALHALERLPNLKFDHIDTKIKKVQKHLKDYTKQLTKLESELDKLYGKNILHSETHEDFSDDDTQQLLEKDVESIISEFESKLRLGSDFKACKESLKTLKKGKLITTKDAKRFEKIIKNLQKTTELAKKIQQSRENLRDLMQVKFALDTDPKYVLACLRKGESKANKAQLEKLEAQISEKEYRGIRNKVTRVYLTQDNQLCDEAKGVVKELEEKYTLFALRKSSNIKDKIIKRKNKIEKLEKQLFELDIEELVKKVEKEYEEYGLKINKELAIYTYKTSIPQEKKGLLYFTLERVGEINKNPNKSKAEVNKKKQELGNLKTEVDKLERNLRLIGTKPVGSISNKKPKNKGWVKI